MSNGRFTVNWQSIRAGKYKIMLCCAVFFLTTFLSRYVAYSITDSVGAHLFIRTACPSWPDFQRWQLVEIPVPADDPHLPTGVRHLIKRAGCLPGETIVRRGITYFCRTRHGNEVQLGDVKFRSVRGKKMAPWMYDPLRDLQQYQVKKDELFLFGIPSPGSYDSRYLGPVERGKIWGCLTAVF